MIEQRHNGHEWTARRQQALGQIRAGLDSARRFIDELEESPAESSGESVPSRVPRRGAIGKGKIAAVAVATALELLARRERLRQPPRRKGPGIFKLALLAAAVLAAGKLIVARR
jgi:hypothetical protein